MNLKKQLVAECFEAAVEEAAIVCAEALEKHAVWGLEKKVGFRLFSALFVLFCAVLTLFYAVYTEIHGFYRSGTSVTRRLPGWRGGLGWRRLCSGRGRLSQRIKREERTNSRG